MAKAKLIYSVLFETAIEIEYDPANQEKSIEAAMAQVKIRPDAAWRGVPETLHLARIQIAPVQMPELPIEVEKE